MTSCKHIWEWREKEYRGGVPLELEVWCTLCSERHELVLAFGPVTPPEQKAKRFERFNKEIDRLMEDEIREAY